MWESIKGNLWKGAASFSGFFPSMGSLLGAGMMMKSIDKFFPKTKKK